MRVSAIIPAYNEEKTIYDLVRAIKNSGIFDEVIVVNDGSRDNTAFLAQKAGAVVLTLPKNLGKGEALIVGVRASQGEVILFFDADLLGVTKEHLENLVNPVKNGEADMVVGIQPKYRNVYEINNSIPLISGQRALRRKLFEGVPEKLLKGYQVEEALNYFAKLEDKKVKVIILEGLEHLQKIPKSDLLKGVCGYFKMALQIAKIFVLARIFGVFRKIKRLFA